VGADAEDAVPDGREWGRLDRVGPEVALRDSASLLEPECDAPGDESCVSESAVPAGASAVEPSEGETESGSSDEFD
jgi:hypothetical protein